MLFDVPIAKPPSMSNQHKNSNYIDSIWHRLFNGINMINEICKTDINIGLGVCALTGCGRCGVFMLTIGPMTFRIDEGTLTELLTMLRSLTNSEQHKNNVAPSLSAYKSNAIKKH